MLHTANLSDGFWQDTVQMAIHLINWSTHTGLEHMMPEQSWSGVKPDVTNLRIFGCPAYVLIPKELCVGKLAHKMHHCIFIRYSSTHKAWQFWNPVKCSIIESRDAVFNECVQCCDHPMPLVDLSLLEDMDDVGDEVSPVDMSPVTDSDVTNSDVTNPCPIIDPRPVTPLAIPVVPPPAAPPP